MALRKLLMEVTKYMYIMDDDCLISYRAGAWHYRIFPDFLNSGFKMASTTEGKAEESRGHCVPLKRY